MVEWNPVEGLEEIAYENLRIGDEVVMFSFGENYKRVTIDDLRRFGYNNKYYLLNREEPKEPEGRGDLAIIYLKGEGEQKTVYCYIRTRPKFADKKFQYGSNDPWTDEGNNVTKDWAGVLKKVGENEKYGLRIFTAKYEAGYSDA